jgi:hypothetical protein
MAARRSTNVCGGLSETKRMASLRAMRAAVAGWAFGCDQPRSFTGPTYRRLGS